MPIGYFILWPYRRFDQFINMKIWYTCTTYCLYIFKPFSFSNHNIYFVLVYNYILELMGFSLYVTRVDVCMCKWFCVCLKELCVESYVYSCNMLVLISFCECSTFRVHMCVIMLTYHTCHIHDNYDSHNRHDIPIFQNTEHTNWHFN
jgi:hypothetical protein